MFKLVFLDKQLSDLTDLEVDFHSLFIVGINYLMKYKQSSKGLTS